MPQSVHDITNPVSTGSYEHKKSVMLRSIHYDKQYGKLCELVPHFTSTSMIMFVQRIRKTVSYSPRIVSKSGNKFDRLQQLISGCLYSTGISSRCGIIVKLQNNEAQRRITPYYMTGASIPFVI